MAQEALKLTSSLVLALAAANVADQHLSVVNKCHESVFLFTQTSTGTISNDVTLAAGATHNMGISKNWDGAINVGTGCNSGGSKCTTGGPTWDGNSPFSRAEFNFAAIPGKVTYDISLIYGYNVGMEISTGDKSCEAFACTISSGCPVSGPSGSCFSPCCSSAHACAGGALPSGGGGCIDNAGPGPHSKFYYTTCPNAYAFPDNDGAGGHKPADEVDYTCSNTAVTLTLCPGTTSHYPKK
ncbi:Osmotin, thaumatin-like protein [Gymnopus androsaceus JB14]|uniref:Osmotin, thaumatin-like protein n=1 Tax=Gymnopus androsaceus JB14 TaxID=1447944 RepID=A0A6A4H144_9AGAR|nr:Osmotin, thaumatin-like protein [Gymnopus androsaceus JB14]